MASNKSDKTKELSQLKILNNTCDPYKINKKFIIKIYNKKRNIEPVKKTNFFQILN